MILDHFARSSWTQTRAATTCTAAGRRRTCGPGGLLIGDNAYLFGRLLDDSDEARAMRRFHEEMAVDYDSVCVPTPDGLAVGVKVSPVA